MNPSRPEKSTLGMRFELPVANTRVAVTPIADGKEKQVRKSIGSILADLRSTAQLSADTPIEFSCNPER
jgi:hypothetical protein